MANIDIVNQSKYHWTVSNQSAARAEVPIIILQEFKQSTSALWASLWFWSHQARTILNNVPAASTATSTEGLIAGAQALFNNDQDPYKYLYIADPTDNVYTLPFYNPYNHEIGQAWSENMGPLGDVVNNYIVPFAKVFSPAGGIEPARAWNGTQLASYSFSFTLLNTVDPENDQKNNRDFIDLLINQNLQTRINSVAATPPCLYVVDVPGVRYSPAAVINNLKVNNVGQINRINGENIPDGYEVNISILELISESTQIFGGVKGNKVSAIVGNEEARLKIQDNTSTGKSLNSEVNRSEEELASR